MLSKSEQRKKEIETEMIGIGGNNIKLRTFEEFVTKMRKGLGKAKDNFATRRALIDELNVTVEFRMENGQLVYYPRCIVKAADTPILYNSW